MRNALTVRLAKSQETRLVAYANRVGLTAPEVARIAIAEYLDTHAPRGQKGSAVMNRDEAIKLIELEARRILEAHGYKDDGLCGRLGDGCEDDGQLWIYWPMTDGETVGLYSDEIMGEGKPATDEERDTLLSGYHEMQAFIGNIEARIA